MNALDADWLQNKVRLVQGGQVALQWLGWPVHLLALAKVAEAVEVALVAPEGVVGVKARFLLDGHRGHSGHMGLAGRVVHDCQLHVVVLEVVEYAALWGEEDGVGGGSGDASQ